MNLKFAASLSVLLSLSTPVWAAGDGSLDVVAAFEVVSADPTTSGTIFTNMGIVETLVNADSEGRLYPGLATEWKVSDDKLEWSFSIRPDVQFHDGTPLTAAAAANALNIAKAKPGLLEKALIADITARDGSLIVTLKEPLAALPAYLAEYRSQILAPAAYGPDGQAVNAIGTGPYRVVTMTPPQSVTAEAFPAYWGEKPQIEKASYTAVGRAETRALMAESGDAEFVYGLDPASYTRLSQSDKVNVLKADVPRSLMLKVNAAHPKLNTVEARQALSLAIDRPGLAMAILRYPAAATQLFPPSVGGWHVTALEPLAYDTAKAAEMLAAQGWKAGPDGILERDGERFSLVLTTYPDRPELPLVAAVLEQQFRQIGIEVKIDSTNSSEIPARHAAGTLELGLVARNFALVPDPIGTVLQDYAPNGDWGAMGWNNTEIVDLAKGLARGDGGDESRAKIAGILQAELPVIAIAWYQQTLAVSNTIKGARIDPWERSFGLSDITWAD
ncbi:MAG: ABC transporter substrate-binding protein [Rhodospirillaceae bacterium]|nr:ABC transporter substrate-binding protein [Rhodospirillaceae bacterium]